MNGSSARLGLHILGVCSLALLTFLWIGFDRWCGNPHASLAVLMGQGGEILIPTRPAWQTRVSPAYWQGRLLLPRLEQHGTPHGYVVEVEHMEGPHQWVEGKGDILPPTASPAPGVPVISHYSAARLRQLEGPH